MSILSTTSTLNTGKDIRPPQTSVTVLGGFPVGLTPTADGKFAVVSGMGYRESLFAVSTADGHIADLKGMGQEAMLHQWAGADVLAVSGLTRKSVILHFAGRTKSRESGSVSVMPVTVKT